MNLRNYANNKFRYFPCLISPVDAIFLLFTYINYHSSMFEINV